MNPAGFLCVCESGPGTCVIRDLPFNSICSEINVECCLLFFSLFSFFCLFKVGVWGWHSTLCLHRGGRCININLSCWRVPNCRTKELPFFLSNCSQKFLYCCIFSLFKISDDSCGGDETCKVSPKVFSFSLFDDRTSQYMIIQQG